MENITILGYFNRSNLGDELYSYAFRNYITSVKGECNLSFYNTDDIQSIPENTNLVICGGGDIMNDYFVDRIHSIIKNSNYSGPLYAISVGIPYESIIDSGKLDIFDYIFTRNRCDSELIEKRFGKLYSHRMNDLVLNKSLVNKTQKDSLVSFGESRTKAQVLDCFRASSCPKDLMLREQVSRESTSQYKIGVCLSRSMYLGNSHYKKIISKLSSLFADIIRINNYSNETLTTGAGCTELRKLLTTKVFIYLIPFNRSDNKDENDILLNWDILRNIQDTETTNYITNVNPQNSNEIIEIFERMDIIICSRFHAHILSILYQIPFISLSHTKKVNELLKDYQLQAYSVKYTLDKEDKPIDIDTSLVQERFSKLNPCLRSSGKNTIVLMTKPRVDMEYINYVNSLITVNHEINREFEQTNSFLSSLIRTPTKRSSPPHYINDKSIDYDIRVIVDNIVRIISEILRIKPNIEMRDILNSKLKLKDILNQASRELIEKCRIYVAKYVCYYITNQSNSPYFYGLYDKIIDSTFSIGDDLVWMYKDYYMNKYTKHFNDNPPKNFFQIFNLDATKQNVLFGYHRSGWAHAVDILYKFNHPNGAILDTFIDSTFFKDNGVLQYMKVIPYTRQWVGILHHTPNTEYSINNTEELFKNPLLIESLTSCIGIYTLSKYLKKWLDNKLKILGFPNIIVNTLIHPTEIPDIEFNYTKYLNSQKVVQIGGWMRNSYGIYELTVPLSITKYALKGKDMNSYFKPSNFNILERVEEIAYVFNEIVGNFGHREKDLISTGIEVWGDSLGGCRHPHPHPHPHSPHFVWVPKRQFNSEDFHLNEKIKSQIPNENDGYGCRHPHPPRPPIFPLPCIFFPEGQNVIFADGIDYYYDNKYVFGLIKMLAKYDFDFVFNQQEESRLQFNKSILEIVDKNDSSVEVISQLENDEYDKLLSESVVFLNLVDVSACNTVIECIVRNTPIIINKLPAVIEMLGDEYPLYYETMEEASEKLADVSLIKIAHEYLMKLDKTKFTSDYFIKSICNSRIYKRLLCN
jgi:hypothetical protein